MQFKATLTDNSTISVMDETGRTANIQWPSEMLPDSIEIGETFEIEMGEKLSPRQEVTSEKSAAELRQLLFELIN